MDVDRKHWNQQQQELRRLLTISTEHNRAIELFLNQHAALHSDLLAGAAHKSFDEKVWQGLTPTDARIIPQTSAHSIAWIYWHLARIEDVTMNVLAAGGTQLFHQDDWLECLKVATQDTGNAMDSAEIANLSAAINIAALREYRLAVGRRTREIVRQLEPGDLKQRVSQDRLNRLLSEGAVSKNSAALLEYWGRLTVASLLLMPPTRHNFIHLNEARQIKETIYRTRR